MAHPYYMRMNHTPRPPPKNAKNTDKHGVFKWFNKTKKGTKT
jgi:hypothetical protein